MRTKRTWTIALSCPRKVKVKQSLNKLRQALRVPGGWGSQISWQLAHEGGEVVSATHRQPLSLQEIFLVLISFRGWVDPKGGLCQWKIPLTPSVIEPATFRLLVQCLNQMRHYVPPQVPERTDLKRVTSVSHLGRFRFFKKFWGSGTAVYFTCQLHKHGLTPLANETAYWPPTSEHEDF